MWPFPEPQPDSYKLFDWVEGLQYDQIKPDWERQHPDVKKVLFDLEVLRVDVLRPRVDFLLGWTSAASQAFVSVSCAGNYYLPGDSKPCRVATGRDIESKYQGMFAHELGHILRENAVEIREPIAPDVGWDVGWAQGRLGFGQVKLEDKRNLMDPGRTTAERWAAAETYSGVLESLATASYPTSASQAFSVPVNESFTAFSGPIYEIDRDGPPITPSSTGPGELRVLDASSQLLYSTRLSAPAIVVEEEQGPVPGRSVVEVPHYPSAEKIELRQNGVLQTTRVRSTHSPTVTILSPVSGATLTDTVTVSWQAVDDDGDSLEAFVSYSKDSAERVPLAFKVAGPTASFTVDTEGLAASEAAIISVVVTDGFNTTVADATQLQLGPNHPPTVWFWQPSDGAVYRQGANIMLLGAAQDLEDGALPDTAVSWFSSIDGLIAQGYGVNALGLSVGTHTIELRATDSDGAITSAFATITIQ
jgi:hypothetical protein